MRFRAPFAALLVLAAPLAHAQLSASGARTDVAPPAGTAPVRWPDVAYDPDDDVYLAVSGANAVMGQFLAADGTALGAPFVVNAGSNYCQAPRVAYGKGSGAFLVAWHETVSSSATQVRGRLVRYGQAPLTSAFDISAPGTNWEMGAAMAYSTSTRSFLVSWQATNTSLHAQRVGDTGALVGGDIDVDPTGRYHRDPAVSATLGGDTFLVAYAGCEANNTCFVEARRIEAASGQLLGPSTVLDSNLSAGYVPEVAYTGALESWLVVWNRRMPGSSTFMSSLVGHDGSATAATLVSNTVGSYDASSIAYNPVSNTFVWVTHGSASRDAALELSAMGAPQGALVSFGDPASNGNFNPRIAASTKEAGFVGVGSAAFAKLTAQSLSTATRDPTTPLKPQVDAGVVDAGEPDAGEVDAGKPDSGVTGVPDAGEFDAGIPPDAPISNAPATADAGEFLPAMPEATGGCGCSSAAPIGWAAALFVAAARLLRGRRCMDSTDLL